ncbi:MAG TPA: cytochrome b N-terminal domain-containing protein [Acidimicrobiales bacterium]|nr:cytochrome b N-terminal domain-containing protein [Acidimicrobiales bacterium]
MHPAALSGVLSGSAINLNGNGHYVHWGFIQISWANLIVIGLMILVFIAAVLIPFRHPSQPRPDERPGPLPGTPPQTLPGDEHQWSAHVRMATVDALPPDRLLPDRQPAYVASWVYTFGVITISALVLVILTGIVLSIFGPSWWHNTGEGHFVNSLHLWSVEGFFFFMVLHLWGKFFMAAWRGRRRMTWVTGAIAFTVSVAAAFTGYVSQQNFDSQWISTQAKDGINSTGAGAFFNVLNFGQMLMWHIVLLPLVVSLLAAGHVLLVRRRGVVPPFERAEPGQPAEAAPARPLEEVAS